MRLGWWSGLCLLGVVAASSQADIAGDIAAVLQDKLLQRAEVGIQIVQLGLSGGDDKIIFKHNADFPRTPASNLKIVTTAAAVDRLGEEFKFQTRLLLREGDLYLLGAGDPTLGDAELLKKLSWGTTTLFQNWAESLKKRGIASIRNVIIDDSVFDETFVNPNWKAEELHKRYMAQAGGINLNANAVDFYIRPAGSRQRVNYRIDPDTRYISLENSCISGSKDAVWLSRPLGTNSIILRGEASVVNEVPISVTVHDPPMYAGTVLAETLGACGIKMGGEVKRNRAAAGAYAKSQDGWALLAVHETPLAAVVTRANKDSMNLYAECLCKRLGHETTGASGSWENGTAAMGAFLKRLGVGAEEYKLIDGSGLARDNAITASAMVRVLSYSFHSKNWPLFHGSLAVGGVDGTLDNRFRGDLRGRVFGKSGFINGVSALSGYLKARDDRWYAFSILINGIPPSSNSSIKPLHDRIVGAIDAHAGRSRMTP